MASRSSLFVRPEVFSKAETTASTADELASPGGRAGALSLLLLLFFLSGFAALLYQVVWQRLLIFHTGSDTASISIIVIIFMLGLGLGYLAGGSLSDRSSPARNLFYFVLAELGIMLFAAGSTTLLYDQLFLAPPPGLGRSVVIALVLLAMFIPTFLMGVSLPVLSKAIRSVNLLAQARYIGKLYSLNTIGAACGALVSGVLLIPAYGYADTIWFGVVLNGACAAGGLMLGLRGGNPIKEAVRSGNAPQAPLRPSPVLALWSAQYALSGFAALALELIWFRILNTLIKSVSLTFSILLAIYLGSMGVGVIFGTWLCRNRGARERERLFLGSQVVLYLSTGASILLFLAALQGPMDLSHLVDYFASYEPDLTPSMVLWTHVAIPIWLMFIPTFLMGLSFSVSQTLVQDRQEEVGRKLGWLQFVNIIGSALGAAFVAWIGFPLFGTANLLKFITAIALIYGGLLWYRGHWHVFPALAGAALVLSVVLAMPGNFGFWRALNGMERDADFLFAEDGSGSSVIKNYPQPDGSMHGTVFANGLGQSLMPYRRDPTHTVLGALPALLHPHPEKIAVIGLGSAGTLHGVQARAVTRNIICFEIMEGQVPVLTEHALLARDTAILATLRDPRLQIVIADGRHQLHTRPDRYDIIEADALRPNSAFSGNIYSREYFQLLRSRLAPGGMAVTWCPTARVLATFRTVFPHVLHVEGLLLIGSNEAVLPEREAVLQRLADPFTQTHFRRAGIDAEALIMPVLDRLRPLEAFTPMEAQINTDLFPRDEYSLPQGWSNGLQRLKARVLGN
jgi:spermidine synthase